MGKHIAEFAPPGPGIYALASGDELEIKQDYFDNQRSMIDILDKEGKITDWEAYYCHKDGKLIIIEQNIFYLNDTQGKRIGSVGVLRDITERKMAEERLQATTVFLDNIFESSLDSIVVSDGKGYMQRVNKAFLQLLDCEENGVLGKSMSQLSVIEEGTYETCYGEKIKIGKDHIDYLMDMLSRFIEEGKITNWESYVFRKDGKVIPVEVNIVKLYDEKGDQSGSVGIVRDITERRKSESEITATRDFLENIIESSIDPIIIGDSVGTVTRTNKAFQNLLHYEEHEITGKHIGEFVPVEVGTYESRAGTVVELDDNFFREAEEKMTELVERGSLASWKVVIWEKMGKLSLLNRLYRFCLISMEKEQELLA